MLRQVLMMVEAAKGPITLAELGRQLNIAPGALEGMLAHWARKGRLTVAGEFGPGEAKACAGSCFSCGGSAACPFMARLPRTFLVTEVAGPPVASSSGND
jgi:hypothetical protein